MAFVSLDVAKRLLAKDDPTSFSCASTTSIRAPKIADSISATLGPDYVAQDWADMNKSLFSALWLEKMAISLTIGLIVMVAALNIVASLILLVMEKHRDIAILKTMGASARSITRIFMMQGLMIGIVGTTAGAVAGCAMSLHPRSLQADPRSVDVYQIRTCPSRSCRSTSRSSSLAAILVICFIATIYPSRQAAKLDPAQALRYDDSSERQRHAPGSWPC